MLRMEQPSRGGVPDPLRGFVPGQRWMDFPFPGGLVRVEIAGDGGKLAINQARPEALGRVIAACGVDSRLLSITRNSSGRLKPMWTI